MKKQYLKPTATVVSLPQEEFVTASSFFTYKYGGSYFDTDLDDDDEGGSTAPIFDFHTTFNGTFE